MSFMACSLDISLLLSFLVKLENDEDRPHILGRFVGASPPPSLESKRLSQKNVSGWFGCLGVHIPDEDFQTPRDVSICFPSFGFGIGSLLIVRFSFDSISLSSLSFFSSPTAFTAFVSNLFILSAFIIFD